jgi:carbamoyl-phosphate synthase large subunit
VTESRERVLVFPGTSLVGIEVFRGLSYARNLSVLGAGFDVEAGRAAGYDEFFFLPGVHESDFEQRFRELVSESHVTVIFPSNEVAIEALSRFEAPGVRVVRHSVVTSDIAGSKIQTHRLLTEIGVVPKRLENLSDDTTFPLFAKPDRGHSSQGTFEIADSDALTSTLKSKPHLLDDYLVTEMLPGDEVTVDCFGTSQDGLLFARARKRRETNQGVSVLTEDFADPDLSALASTISEIIEFNGPWFFQAKQDYDGKFKVMEIGARLAGASAIRRAQGVNLPELAVLASTPQKVQIYESRFDLCLDSRMGQASVSYVQPFEALYVDLDDTLIVNGSPHSELVALMVRAREAGAEVRIITRHRDDPAVTLERHGLTGISDGVIHLRDGESKASYLPNSRLTLFVDDSFSERASMQGKSNVLAVDPSASNLVRGLFA